MWGVAIAFYKKMYSLIWSLFYLYISTSLLQLHNSEVFLLSVLH